MSEVLRVRRSHDVHGMNDACRGMGNVSGRNSSNAGYRMDPFKYIDVLNYGEFAEVYNRALHPPNATGQAGGSTGQAGGHEAQPRSRPVAGALQALQDLRLGEAAKPRSQQAGGKASGSVGALQPTPKTAQTPVPFEERVKQDFDHWLTGGSPAAQRAQAADRMEYAELEQETTLKLDRLALGRIPAKLGQFKHLRELWIGGNELDHLPGAVFRLENLQTLDARDNQMTELTREIGRLTSLKQLNVDSNQLKSLPPALARLIQLKKFSARFNQLKLVPAQLEELKNLRTLDLSHNQLWDLPGTWGKLFRLLEDVDLSHNQLQQLPPTCEKPVGKLKLDLSENPMETLPTAYSGFTYASFHITAADDHKLKNVGGKVTVKTKGTRIRQGLVNESRLAPGRGIVPQGPQITARSRPLPRPLHDHDCDSIYSVLSHLRDHAEPGEIEGLERVGQGAGADDAVSSDWGGRRLHAWVEPLAEQYAQRNGPAASPRPPPPPPEPAPDPWEPVHADLFDMQAAVGRPPAPLVRRLAPAPQLQPDLLATLHAELSRLSEPQASAVAGYLNNLPQPMLVAALAQLQNGSWAGMPAGAARSHGMAPMFEAAPAPPRGSDAQAAWFAAAAPFGHGRAV